MNVSVIRQLDIDSNLPEEVLYEINRIAENNVDEKWFNKYLEACARLSREGHIEYSREALFKKANELEKVGESIKAKQLRWATANLWWSTDVNTLTKDLVNFSHQAKAEGRRKEADWFVWLSDNIPWGKKKVITEYDLFNLSEKLEYNGNFVSALFRSSIASMSINDTKVATLEIPYRKAHGESRIENPSVLLVMLLS